MQQNDFERRRRCRRGVTMLPTLLAVSAMSIFALALLMSVTSTKRSANHQADEYRLSSTVESVAMLATEKLWSGYLASQGGNPGTITSFRNYLTALGIAQTKKPLPPGPDDGLDVLPLIQLSEDDGKAVFQDVNVEQLRVVRNDVDDSTQLYLTISATTNRGAGLVNPVLDRALQQVYTIEPEAFEGFDYALLANNVNCIFCHASVDSADRFYNSDPGLFGTFDRVKVGTLETLMLRHHKGAAGPIYDGDADSFVAGTVYIRGTATDQAGVPLTNWASLAFQGYGFDHTTGKLIQKSDGDLKNLAFSPAGFPAGPMESLYLDYPDDYAEMPDGNLPLSFPAPIPDDGGIDPSTGLPDPAAAGNKLIDDFEFDALAATAEGAITSGVINVVPPGETLDATEYAAAVLYGNLGSVQGTVHGNLVLTGTQENYVTIDGTVAVDGDLLISGYVKGEGSLIVRGNIYVPNDVKYLDLWAYQPGDATGWPTGPRAFGFAHDGTVNALGLAAGGNVLIGDYLAPATKQPDLSYLPPDPGEVVDGTEGGGWNFALAEMAYFNRGEWAKTQARLPDAVDEADDTKDPTLHDPLTGYPSTWVPNPNYVPGYTPRYYHFGAGDAVPIYNLGQLYWDPGTGTWHGDEDVPLAWDPEKISIAHPADPSDPFLYPASGPDPVLVQATPNGGWLPDDVYKASLDLYEDLRPIGKPFTVDGLVYTNNAIFTIVRRESTMLGQMMVNGALVAADVGMLAPGIKDLWGLAPNTSPLSDFAIGLQVNYDARVKEMLNIKNPLQIQLKRTLWNPTANLQ